MIYKIISNSFIKYFTNDFKNTKKILLNVLKINQAPFCSNLLNNESIIFSKFCLRQITAYFRNNILLKKRIYFQKKIRINHDVQFCKYTFNIF